MAVSGDCVGADDEVPHLVLGERAQPIAKPGRISSQASPTGGSSGTGRASCVRGAQRSSTNRRRPSRAHARASRAATPSPEQFAAAPRLEDSPSFRNWGTDGSVYTPAANEDPPRPGVRRRVRLRRQAGAAPSVLGPGAEAAGRAEVRGRVEGGEEASGRRRR